MNAPTTSAEKWRLALHHSLPVAMGYFPAGIAYGVLAASSGLPAWLIMGMSLILYSGAAQFAAIPMLATGVGLFTISLNTLVINLRHLFYALPLLSHLPTNRLAKIYSLFALTDESFSILTTLPENLRQSLMARIIFLNQAYWCIASTLGIWIGPSLNELIPHLDFALVCLFVILAYEQWQSKRIFWPLLLAIAGFALAKWCAPNYLLLAAVGFCALVILLRATIFPKGVDQ